jgi:ABC-2 type transport system permease protein
MIRAVHAEWTKLRTVSSTGWLLLAVVVLTVGASAMVTASLNVRHCPTPATCFEDTTRQSLAGVILGQVAVVILAVLVMSNEYGTKMIYVTLAANPRRFTVVASKAFVVVLASLFAGALGVLGSLLVARNILPGNGFIAVNGYPPLSLRDGLSLRAAGGSVLYLGLIALLSVGVAAILRDTAGATGVMLILLFGFPIAAMFVSDPRWLHRIERYSPMTAGLAIQATKRLAGLPIAPWAGLGLLTAYAGAAVVVGALLFRLRDA